MKRKNFQLLIALDNQISKALQQVDAFRTRLEKLAPNLETDDVHEYAWALAEAKAAHELLIDAKCRISDRLDNMKRCAVCGDREGKDGCDP